MIHFSLVSILSVWLAGANSPLECGSSAHVAGSGPQGRDISSVVQCRNASGHPIEIVEILTGCPCLKAVPERPSLAPGESVKLQMRLATDGLTDQVEFPVEVKLAGGVEPMPVFHYQATIHPMVVAYPEYLDLHDWKQGHGEDLLLVDSSGTAFTVKSASAVRGAVDVRWTEVGLLRINDKWTVANGKSAIKGVLVHVQGKPATGTRKSLSDEVQLELQHPVQKSVRIRVVGFAP